MTCNVGKTDRIIRLLLGGAIVALGVIYQNWWGMLGAIPVTTALLGWCPLYAVFGISTQPKE